MPNRGTINRRTGKTTPRSKVKTHWGGLGMRGPRPDAKKAGSTGAARASAPKKATR